MFCGRELMRPGGVDTAFVSVAVRFEWFHITSRKAEQSKANPVCTSEARGSACF
jgi:hypothetical protein